MNLTEQPRSIVVGVDGTAASVDALVFALCEAAACGTSVEVVTAWSSQQSTRASAQQLQDRAVAQALCRSGERPVIARELVEAEPVDTLLAAARRARALVLGTGRGRVAERCLLEAKCPVLVVRQRTSVTVGTTTSGISA